MSNRIFSNETYVNQDGCPVITSTSMHSIVEYYPAIGVASYRRRQ